MYSTPNRIWILKHLSRRARFPLVNTAANRRLYLPAMPLNIAMVQLDPQIGLVDNNIKKAKELTKTLQPGSVDLLCFPEMAFTGYSFPDLASITPHLETPTEGPTVDFCSALAKRIGCFVAVGYPERLPSFSLNEVLAANSALLISRDGTVISNYRKTNLFEVDKPWAQPGSGFTAHDLPEPLGRLSLGICMDLNPNPPHLWASSAGPFELADFSRNQNCRLLILLCNWLDSKVDPETSWDICTINHWIARLRPLWDAREGETLEADQERIVVICNRVGVERGNIFAGSSIIFRMSRSAEEPECVGVMRRNEEAVKTWAV
ncbi:hypothetical protein BS47DRAFT_1315323 [Hydnum rufescens UP504]|uniref:CN hydrolase domain-containing protein n=1 Tax=Hydnum rufescens UP504 TaxID=1448309 RepID=A0A9P6B2L6_9AGAM|nr:hypothetical protein BS47DRAFT_1315323 [Hydnum rufescens UP504]